MRIQDAYATLAEARLHEHLARGREPAAAAISLQIEARHLRDLIEFTPLSCYLAGWADALEDTAASAVEDGSPQDPPEPVDTCGNVGTTPENPPPLVRSLTLREPQSTHVHNPSTCSTNSLTCGYGHLSTYPQALLLLEPLTTTTARARARSPSMATQTPTDDRLVRVLTDPAAIRCARLEHRREFLDRAVRLEERGGGWVISRSAIRSWWSPRD